MGTRSSIRVFDEFAPDIPLLNMYGQWDGNAGGVGRDLALYLKRMTVVNGISDYKAKNTANGASCLAAQIVAKFKESIGSFYLMPPGQEPEYWNYEVRVTDTGEIRLRVTYDGQQVFNGNPKNFRPNRIEKRAYRD